jgi:dihydrofolate reductase
MTRIRVHSIAVSLDGYAAGTDQSADAPLGVGGELLHPWVFDTRFGRSMIGQPGGTTGVDNTWLERGDVGIGATVMGRNMFGPVRGEWPDYSWRGWWGEEPPYHHPVFVLTHHARAPLTVGETTFHFVSDGLASALSQAIDAAGGLDVRLGGGVSTVASALHAGLVDDIHLAVVPVLLRGGERLYHDLGTWPDAFVLAQSAAGEGALHLYFTRAG